jgi:hypothetical protein
MDYTLDSVTHAMEVIQTLNKDNAIIKEPFFTTDLTQLVDQNRLIYYFGVITNGSGENCLIYFKDAQVIELDQNSQIYLLFSHINEGYNNTQLANLKGQFRGFKIVLV